MDGRADQYALAVMVYQLLAGRLPLNHDDPATMRELAVDVQPADIPGQPTNVNEALARGLAKDPHQRFPNCEEFLKAVVARCFPTRHPDSFHGGDCPAPETVFPTSAARLETRHSAIRFSADDCPANVGKHGRGNCGSNRDRGDRDLQPAREIGRGAENFWGFWPWC